MAGLPSGFLIDVGQVALLLNAIWEYAQLFSLYTCWESWTKRQKLTWTTLAIGGDVVLVIAITLAASWIVGPLHILPLGAMGVAVLLGFGFVTVIVSSRPSR